MKEVCLMNKEKFKNNIKTLAKSTYNNRVLFERRKNSFIVPLIIFILTIFMLCVPSYILSKKVKSSDIIKNFPEIYAPMESLLTRNLDCTVNNSLLVCNEGAEKVNVVVGDTIKYTIIANNPTISVDTNVVYENPKDTDNLILLLSQYIKIRYCQRDYVNGKVKTYEIIGDYSDFEGYSFKEISQKIANNPEILNNEIESFVHTTYTSTLDTKLLVNLASLLVSFLLLIIVATVILKGPYIFRRKKGFKLSECLKISLTSALPALLIGMLIYFITGIDFASSFGAVFMVRIVYIYFKYIFSTKNNIYKTLYSETKEERFNV